MNGNWGASILVNAAFAAWLIYEITMAAEAPRQAVAVLQYIALALALVGLVGSWVMKYRSDK